MHVTGRQKGEERKGTHKTETRSWRGKEKINENEVCLKMP